MIQILSIVLFVDYHRIFYVEVVVSPLHTVMVPQESSIPVILKRQQKHTNYSSDLDHSFSTSSKSTRVADTHSALISDSLTSNIFENSDVE